jgi:hypothetical protein
MPSNPGGPPVPPSILRRRGRSRLSAVTAGVGVAGVLATGAIAATLPGSTHGSAAAKAGDTGSAAHSGAGSSGTGSGSGSQSSGGSRSGSSSSILPSTGSGGAHATSGAS